MPDVDANIVQILLIVVGFAQLSLEGQERQHVHPESVSSILFFSYSPVAIAHDILIGPGPVECGTQHVASLTALPESANGEAVQSVDGAFVNRSTGWHQEGDSEKRGERERAIVESGGPEHTLKDRGGSDFCG